MLHVYYLENVRKHGRHLDNKKWIILLSSNIFIQTLDSVLWVCRSSSLICTQTSGVSLQNGKKAPEKSETCNMYNTRM